MGIGERLIEELQRLGLSQGEFAALAGLSDRAQRMYEKEERHPDTQYLLAVAAGGVDMVYVLTGQRGMDTVGVMTAEESALVENYRAASAEHQASLRAVGASFAEQDKRKEQARKASNQ